MNQILILIYVVVSTYDGVLGIDPTIPLFSVALSQLNGPASVGAAICTYSTLALPLLPNLRTKWLEGGVHLGHITGTPTFFFFSVIFFTNLNSYYDGKPSLATPLFTISCGVEVRMASFRQLLGPRTTPPYSQQAFR